MKDLNFVWTLRMHNSDLCLKWLQNMTVAGCIIDLWRMRLRTSEIERQVNDIDMQNAVTDHSGIRNVVWNFTRLPMGEAYWGDGVSQNGWWWMMYPEHKSVLLMKDMMHKFCKPFQELVVAYEWMMNWTKACLSLDGKTQLVEWKKMAAPRSQYIALCRISFVNCFTTRSIWMVKRS